MAGEPPGESWGGVSDLWSTRPSKPRDKLVALKKSLENANNSHNEPIHRKTPGGRARCDPPAQTPVVSRYDPDQQSYRWPVGGAVG